jgi:hypothetical protein
MPADRACDPPAAEAMNRHAHPQPHHQACGQERGGHLLYRDAAHVREVKTHRHSVREPIAEDTLNATARFAAVGERSDPCGPALSRAKRSIALKRILRRVDQ